MEQNIRKALRDFDEVIFNNGTIEIRENFFLYTHGRNTRHVAAHATRAMRRAGYEITVTNSAEVWNQWPEDSYFTVQFQVVQV